MEIQTNVVIPGKIVIQAMMILVAKLVFGEPNIRILVNLCIVFFLDLLSVKKNLKQVSFSIGFYDALYIRENHKNRGSKHMIVVTRGEAFHFFEVKKFDSRLNLR